MAVERLQSLVTTGQFLAAYREAERLALDPGLDPALRAKVYIVGVKAALGLREVYAAAKMAEKAIEAAEMGADWEDIGNARLYAALSYGQLGDTVLALRFFGLFFEYLDRYSELQSKTAFAYYNLALVHEHRREYAEALRYYQLAAEDFAKLEHHPGRLACLDNMAWVLLRQDRAGEAELLLSQAESLLPEVGEAHEYLVSHMIIQAYHHLQTGSSKRTMELCEEVFQPGRQGVTDRHLALGCWLMAHVAMDSPHLEQATLFSQLAVKHALDAKEPSLMNLASEIRQRVEAKKMEHRSQR
jgi:tetratricopeptide (TPR) repeat protein